MPIRSAVIACCVLLSGCYLPTSFVTSGPPDAYGSGAAPASASQPPQQAAPAPGTLANLDAKRGFRDVKLGMSLESITGLSAPSEEEGMTIYSRASDSLALGSGTLSRIRYGFSSGRLVMITLEASGAANSDAMLEAFQAAYGPGTQRNRFIKSYFWAGESVLMMYSRKPGQTDSSVAIGDKAFGMSVLKAREQKAANADL